MMERKMSFIAIVFLFGMIRLHSVQGRSVDSEENQCRVFFFYDHGTAMCEHCRDICDHAELRGTEEQCASSCADYLRAKNCTADEYFDEQVRQCSPCAELCTHRQARGTEDQCNKKCKGYMSKKDPDITLNTASQPGQKTQDDSQILQMTSTSTLVLLSVFAGATLILLLAVGIYCTRVGFTACRQASQRDDTSDSVHELEALKYGEEEQGQPGERAELVPNTT